MRLLGIDLERDHKQEAVMVVILDFNEWCGTPPFVSIPCTLSPALFAHGALRFEGGLADDGILCVQKFAEVRQVYASVQRQTQRQYAMRSQMVKVRHQQNLQLAPTSSMAPVG